MKILFPNFQKVHFRKVRALLIKYCTKVARIIIKIFFLDLSAEDALYRIQQRARPEEANANVHYLQKLIDLYKNWLVRKKSEGTHYYYFLRR